MELLDWRGVASRKLDAQQGRARDLLAYYEGTEDIPAILDTAERQTFQRLLAESHSNWSALVVRAVAERLSVTGFRVGPASDLAWLIWQASSMDADAELVQTDALVCGSSFVLVQPDDDNPTGVSITAESPLEATVLYEPGSRREAVAGYKRFGVPGQQQTEILILPDMIATWEDGYQGEPLTQPNPAGTAMVEITPQPRTIGSGGASELELVMPIQDRINTTTFARLVATDFGAFRQVWATGVKMARETVGTDADTGEPIVRPVKPFNVGADRLLVNENADGRFGAMPGDPLAGYLAAVAEDVNHLAAITQTPPNYLLGSMINLSADAIKAAEAGLVSKISQRARHIGEDWERVIRLALGMVGDPGAADVEAEVIWADWETRSEAQRADAIVKMATIGVPRRVLWEKWGATPQELDRWQALADAEAAQQATTAAASLGLPDIAAMLGGQPGG